MAESPSKSPLSPKRGGFVYARTQRYMQAIKNTVTPKHSTKDKKPISESQTPEGSIADSVLIRNHKKAVNSKSGSLPHTALLEKETENYVIRKSNSSSLSNIFKKLSPKFRRAKKGDKIVSIYDDTRRQSSSSYEGYESDSAVERNFKQQPGKQHFTPLCTSPQFITSETPSPQRLSSPESGQRSYNRSSSSEQRRSADILYRLSPDRLNAQSPSSSLRSSDLKPPSSLNLKTNLTRLTRQLTEDSIGTCSLNVIATSNESLNSTQAGPRRVFMDTSIITIGSCSLNVDVTSGDSSIREGERTSASQHSLVKNASFSFQHKVKFRPFFKIKMAIFVMHCMELLPLKNTPQRFRNIQNNSCCFLQCFISMLTDYSPFADK